MVHPSSSFHQKPYRNHPRNPSCIFSNPAIDPRAVVALSHRITISASRAARLEKPERRTEKVTAVLAEEAAR
jgi:hypothetical protein